MGFEEGEEEANGQFSVLDDQALIGQNCTAILKCYNATCSFTVFRGERPAFRVFFSALTGIISHLAICICICICFHICVNLSGVLLHEVPRQNQLAARQPGLSNKTRPIRRQTNKNEHFLAHRQLICTASSGHRLALGIVEGGHLLFHWKHSGRFLAVAADQWRG